jgi:vacuolar-type H+-ATPase subunit H
MFKEGFHMARELFEAVRTAENKADQIIQDAQKEAREELKKAQAEIDGNERAVALEHRAMYQNILEDKRQGVQARIAANRPNVEKAQAAVISEARGKLAGAAQRIVKEVWNDGDR